MRKVVFVLVLVLTMASGAWADFGNGNTSVTVSYFPPSLDVDFSIVATTTGAATPGYGSNDRFQFIAQLYQTNAGVTTTSTIDISNNTRTGPTPTTFSYSHSLTAPYADTWLWWTRFAAVNPYQCDVTTGGVYCYWSIASTDYGSIDVDPTLPTPTPPPGGYGGDPIPTLSMPALLVLGGILMGVGVLLLRRR